MATVWLKWKPIVKPRGVGGGVGGGKPKSYRQASTHWLKFYEEAVIESEARTAVVQLKCEKKVREKSRECHSHKQ